MIVHVIRIVSRSTKDDRLLQRLFSLLFGDRKHSLPKLYGFHGWFDYLVSGELKVVNQLGGGSDGSLP